MFVMTRVLWIALLVGCGHPAPAPSPPPHVVGPAPVAPPPDAGPPPPLDRDLPRLAALATKLYQDIDAAFAAAGEDCAAAVQKLTALHTTYAEVVVANAKVLRDGRTRDLRAALEPHAADLDAAAKAIVQSRTMATCSPDHVFTDSFDALVGAPP